MNCEISIVFSTIEDIKNFVRITTMSSGDFSVIEGRHILDGKSLMGLISLPFNSPLKLVAKNAEPECIRDLQKLFEKEEHE